MSDAEAGRSVTQLLAAWSGGDAAALDALMPLVYDELRRVAGRQLASERGSHTLQPTALVNEAFLRLVDQTRASWKDRTHFYSVAAQIMRRILIDHARRRLAGKRGGGAETVSLDGVADWPEPRDLDVILLDEALTELATFDPRQSRVVELRFFAGLSVEETAEALQLSTATVKREWRMARAWLVRQLRPEGT